MYVDRDFTQNMTVHTDTICNILEDDHIICDYFMVDDTVGVFSLFSGLAELDLVPTNNGTNYRAIGTGRYVFQGGSDLHGGIIGKVNTVYEENLISHDFCVQGSTYNHVIDPLPPSDSNSKESIYDGASASGQEDLPNTSSSTSLEVSRDDGTEVNGVNDVRGLVYFPLAMSVGSLVLSFSFRDWCYWIA